MFTWVTLLTTDTDYQIINSLHGSLGFFLYIISHVLYKAFIHLCGNFLALWSWFEQTFKEVFKYHRLTFLVKNSWEDFIKPASYLLNTNDLPLEGHTDMSLGLNMSEPFIKKFFVPRMVEIGLVVLKELNVKQCQLQQTKVVFFSSEKWTCSMQVN